ncbi:MAG: 4Fe-4S binding protein, partial [Candidatus Eisenbacteria bacterium]|nr:4Fe-4S binding protein [Candidatus Latescibacterota bacterium]MBD3302856.1 4Fe-4S binding protein [Candidatus Eisenbacteria bacterium]
ILSTQGLQFWLMSLMSIGMYAVILLNLLGTKMAGGNLGILMVWVVWLFALVVLLVPLLGRAWCTVCPIPMAGDALQRGTTVGVRTGKTGITNNAYYGLNRRWPRFLSGVVPRTISFLCFGTISVLVISQPRWTGWALVLLLGLGTLLPLVFEHRAFCRFLCPINSFISLYARMGRIGLRAKQQSFCNHCVKQDIVTCERGNQHGWACPYGLAVNEIEDNAECGLCMECLRSCHYTNISIYWRKFELDRLLRGSGEALQASVMLTLAIAYAILFQGPWYGLRDMVDLVDKKNWGLFAYYAVTLWVIALVLVPLVIRGLAALGGRIAAAREPLAILYPRTASSLVPMGLFLWIAFAIPMLQTQGSFILSTLSDPFGWGWNLFGTAGYPWIQLWPESIPWIQSAMVLLGFAFALSTAYRAWSVSAAGPRRALRGVLPIGAFLFLLSAGMLWFFTA